VGTVTDRGATGGPSRGISGLAVRSARAAVPGRTVNRMAGVFRGEGKTDAKDARLIAHPARIPACN
jgi:hypothetical protein